MDLSMYSDTASPRGGYNSPESRSEGLSDSQPDHE